MINFEMLKGTKIVQTVDNGSFILRTGSMFDGVSRKSVKDVDIEIENGLIKAIEKRGNLDILGLPIEDCSDFFVMPGLIEAHIHLSGMKTPDAYRRYFEPHDLRVIRALRHSETLLSCGYTSVRDLGGNSVAVGLREASKLGMVRVPRIKTAIEYLSPTGGHGDWPLLPYDMVKSLGLRSRLVDGEAECIRAIRRLSREKADFVKIVISSGSMGQPYERMRFNDNFSMKELQAMTEEAHEEGKMIAAHTVGSRGIQRALEVGIDSLEHCFFSFEKNPELLDQIVDKGTFIVPTLSIIRWQGENEEKKGNWERAQRYYQNVEHHGRFIKQAFEAGVPIACGTDETGTRGTGRCSEEYEYMAKAGIPNYGILWGCTSIAARVMGIADITGSLEVGKSADILVLRKNPLEDISVLQKKENIVYVMQGDT